jgi:hypothetical protein
VRLLVVLVVVCLHGGSWRRDGGVEVQQVHCFGSGGGGGGRRSSMSGGRGRGVTSVLLPVPVSMPVVVVAMAGTASSGGSASSSRGGRSCGCLGGGGCRHRRGHGRCDVLLQLVFVSNKPLDRPHRVRLLGLLKAAGQVRLVVGIDAGVSPLLHELHAGENMNIYS